MPFNLFSSAKRRGTGIDLGSSSVKVVQLSRQKVTVAAICNILPAERAETPILISKLRQFFDETGITGANVAIALPGEYTFVRTISLPLMPEKELAEAVKWEIRRQNPYTEEEVISDFVSKETPAGNTVTFASAEKKSILKYVQLFEEAGVKVTAVDIAPLALMRALGRETPESYVMADIGSSAMEILIVRSGIMRIARTVEMGSDIVLNALISAGRSLEESHDLIQSSMTDEMKPSLNQILREISRSIDYYKANYKDSELSTLILAGGICRNQQILDYIVGTIKMRVEVPNPFNGYNVKNNEIYTSGPRFTLAMGLAKRID